MYKIGRSPSKVSKDVENQQPASFSCTTGRVEY
jgi:hypothetical protein